MAGVLTLGLAACASKPSAPVRSEPTKSVGYISPLPDFRVTSNFGRRGNRPHYGIDLKATRNTPISAVAPGRVTYAGWMRGFGRIVIVAHDKGRESYYAHMSKFAVDEGTRVGQGEVLGFVGATGNATGPHLHFEVRENGKPIDPLLVMNTGPQGGSGNYRSADR